MKILRKIIRKISICIKKYNKDIRNRKCNPKKINEWVNIRREE